MVDVLVVDDDFMVARIHAGFVERTPGYRVVGTAYSGTEALRLAHELAPDLLLLDVHLPDMSGLQVLRELRARGSVVAVVVVTAERDAEAVRAALHGGAMQYLVKPFQYDDLAARLQHVREALAVLSRGDTDQAEIDRAFALGPAATVATTLPKGLSEATAQLVLDCLQRHGEQSAAQCAAMVGLSRVTARRYLEHFAGEGRVKVRPNYGGAGRPEHLYRLP